MKTIQMEDLNDALIGRGYESRFEMTGGNCGTIYFNFTDEKGSVYMSIGPANFTTGQARADELCWARDEMINGELNLIEESITYYDPEAHGEFTISNLLEAILDQITD